ncbi:ABC transporter ATP-binding protein [Metabacillus fastidiosus]|uniref:ABC transporter ATP-binding protein n=1 Tax=Metabacillus fastidiosus TaxID=1458 RepID=A0ABU6P0A2_9BACI|nr:ABC transporter ATP-binding protein [Metabacillus fastidiosus]MED4401919.1 ABC transporter ATP-binding protein [Metabacillus fastidiosus]MED4454632.1 ABC transporter ATP-binding protein [Metabacillus fastidiosus]MED4460950.1 ABC transporter ATP-binding protein [Metabacillus fastidiosus]
MIKQLTSPFRYKKIEINKDETQKKKKAKNSAATLKRVWNYLAEKRLHLLAVIAMVVISTALGLLGPYLIGRAIDEYIVTRDNTGILTLLVFLLFVFIFNSLSVFLQNYWMIGIAQSTVNKMRTQLFQHLHKLPISFFDKRQHGELMSRMTNDIENVSSTLNSSFIQIFSSALTLVGTVTVMLMLSPLLTLVTMIVIPLMVFGMKWITSRTSRLYKVQQQNIGNLNGFIQETISGQKIIKAYSQEEKVIAEFLEKADNLKRSGFWAQTISGFIPKLMNVLNNLNFTIIAAIGGIFALNGMITIGVIIIFTEYARQFTRPLNDLANQFNTLLSAVAGAERVFEVLDEKEERTDEMDAITLTDVKGNVEFRNVAFSYEDEGDTVRNLSFKANQGEMIALVGPTGAGKSTVINLLSRFYDPDSGEILIDGYDNKKITRESLRMSMAFVLQDSYLFKGTIRENIRYGRLDATDEEIEEAAKKANAHSFIEKLPLKYDTVLEQDGSGISHGQKQLLSIARAILADPKILILDEATSSIDTITELAIQEALDQLMEGRTSFVIAHRLNTIQKADQILVLKDGEIIERGTHQSLMDDKGFYYKLYNH